MNEYRHPKVLIISSEIIITRDYGQRYEKPHHLVTSTKGLKLSLITLVDKAVSFQG